VAKLFKAVQLTVHNGSEYQLQLTSLRLEMKSLPLTNESSLTESKDEPAVRARQIEGVAPQLVAQIASRHESGITLLRIGPVGLITLPPRSPTDSDARILELDPMSHPIIPSESSRAGVVFISKSSLPPDGWDAKGATFLEVILAANLLAFERQVTTPPDLGKVSGDHKDESHWQIGNLSVSAVVSAH
jgi:hypothetical protein